MRIFEQKNLVLITVLLSLAILVLAARGLIVSQNKILPAPTTSYSPNPTIPIYPTISPTTTTSNQACQTVADCPQSLGVCVTGNCPSWRCIDGRCVFFKDAKNLKNLP